MMDERRVYLVTGVSGSGKSTLCREFQRLGYAAYDIDDGFAQWVHKHTGETATYNDDGIMTDYHDWVVKDTELQRVIGEGHQPLWFFGSAHNLWEKAGYFSKMFVLSYPNEDTLRHRIQTRTTNDYGKAPGELEAIIGYREQYEDKFRALGATVIDCSLPIDNIRHILEQSVQ